MSLVKYSIAPLLVITSLACGGPSKETRQTDRVRTTEQKSHQDSISQKETRRLFSWKPIPANRISPYDPIIKKYSRRFGFDWRFIAAQIFTESRFKEDAKSRAGALGLMQILPSTAKYMGLDPHLLLHPEQNIRIGCLYDRRLYSLWKDKKDKHRLAFMLASYNAGRSRVLRAASKSNTPHHWEGVRAHLPKQTRNYVYKIFAKYKQYKKRYF